MGELIDAQPLFPGESDIDQLLTPSLPPLFLSLFSTMHGSYRFVIRKILGPLTEGQREMFLHNPRFLGMKLPEVGRAQTVARRYHGRISASQLSLLKGLTEMDENQRLTIEDAYEHSYFRSLREHPELLYIYPGASTSKHSLAGGNTSTTNSVGGGGRSWG